MSRDDLNPNDFSPEAVATWKKVQREDETHTLVDGAISGRVIFNTGGREKSEPWDYREPGPRSARRDEPIELGRNKDGSPRVLYQQPPPIYSHHAAPGRGSAPRAARLAAAEEKRRVRGAMLRDIDQVLEGADLSARQREAIRLQLSGRTVREIAAEMKCSTGTAQVHLRDAKAKLRASKGVTP